jgi:hypothetical protein
MEEILPLTHLNVQAVEQRLASSRSTSSCAPSPAAHSRAPECRIIRQSPSPLRAQRGRGSRAVRS